MKFKVGDRVVRNDVHMGYEEYSVTTKDAGVMEVVVIINDSDYIDVKVLNHKDTRYNDHIHNVNSKYFDLSGKPRTFKNPTHLVIWEEDRDPHRFCTSEPEAKTFIKGLSDKSSVKKDSILLIEIKSCKKVSISKVLKYNQHKI